MKKIKNILFALMLSLGLVLVGCSSNESSDDAGSPDSNEAETTEEATSDDESLDKIVIGTEGTYRPFTYHDESGELVGYDVETGKAIGEQLGVEVEYREITWEGLLTSVDDGTLDMVTNQVAVTPEREEKYIFSEPYLYTNTALIVLEDNNEVTSFEDAEGLTTSLNVSSQYADVAEDYGIEIVQSETFANDIQLLMDGRTDVVINTDLALAEFLQENPDTPVKIVAYIDEPTKIAIPMLPENEDLKAKIDEAIKALKEDGTLSELSIKHLGEDFTEPKK